MSRLTDDLTAGISTHEAYDTAQAKKVTDLNTRIDSLQTQVTELERQLADCQSASGGSGTVLMGVNYDTAADAEPNYHEGTWAAYRCYRMGAAKDAWNTATIKPKCIVLTDDPNLPVSNPAGVGTALTNMMKDFNSNAERAKCRIVFCWRNEIFNEYTSGSLPTNVVNGFKSAAEAAKAFDNCDVGVNATMFTINSGDAATRWKPIAPYITVGTCSMYPPGRTKSPPVFTPYGDYVPKVLDMFKSWNVLEFMTGEVGIPVDKADQTTGKPTTTNDWTKRPNYMAGHCQYIFDGCKARGMKYTVALYWNEQNALTDATHPPNQFKHDRGKVTPDTADTWYKWKPKV